MRSLCGPGKCTYSRARCSGSEPDGDGVWQSENVQVPPGCPDASVVLCLRSICHLLSAKVLAALFLCLDVKLCVVILLSLDPSLAAAVLCLLPVNFCVKIFALIDIKVCAWRAESCGRLHPQTQLCPLSVR